MIFYGEMPFAPTPTDSNVIMIFLSPRGVYSFALGDASLPLPLIVAPTEGRDPSALARLAMTSRMPS